MLFFKIFVCTFYGLISIAQTLNSRFLFKSLQFNFYSTVFLVQRIVIIGINWRMGRRTFMELKQLVYIIPYAFIMCTINILSSYCVTIMPLAAFMAFKKFVVFFVLVVGIAMSLPNNFNRIHYGCIGCIESETSLGERSLAMWPRLFTRYSKHCHCSTRCISTRREESARKQDLMVANSILSLPYYLGLLIWEKEHEGLVKYFSEPVHPLLFFSLIFAIVLAFSSEYTANTISMKISPFQKASVSNIKDLVLTIISIKYFQDFVLTSFSQVGIFFCLSASVVFSFTLIEKSQKEQISTEEEKAYFEIGHEVEHHQGEGEGEMRV